MPETGAAIGIDRTDGTPSDQMRAAGHLCAALGGWIGGLPGPAPIVDPGWEQVLALAERTKTAGLLAEGMVRTGTATPPAMTQHLAARKEELVRRNFANFLQTLKAQQTLEAAGITALTFKGPLRALDVYGAWGLRGSGDIDMLVPSRSYRAAADVLQQSGYRPLVSRDSHWWHDHLKESPFLPPGQADCIVDLHHGVQQPGGPAPLDIGSFFEQARMVEVGGKAVRMPSPGHSLLITAISFGKAIFAAEPWLRYAHEIAFVLAHSTEGQRQDYRALARRSGMLRLYDAAIASACAIFPHAAEGGNAAGGGPDQLLESALGMAAKGPRHRATHIWRWTDGSGPARGLSFIKGVCHLTVSDLVRRYEGL